MDIQQAIDRAENNKTRPSYFEVLDFDDKVIARRKPYSPQELERTIKSLPEKHVKVQFKKWQGEATRNHFSVVVENPDDTNRNSGTSAFGMAPGIGLSGVSSIHEFAYGQEKAKADKLERENEELKKAFEAKKEETIELKRKIDKMQSDFQIERMEEAGERSSGLSGILNKVSDNPDLLLGLMDKFPAMLQAFSEMNKGAAQPQQIGNGGGSAELQVQHTAQQIAQWFMQRQPQEQQSFMQLLQLMIKENKENQLSYLEIFHNLKSLFNDEESQQANG